MRKYFNTVVSTATGRPLPNASVRIKTAVGDLATIYSDSGGTALSNPVTTDTNGFYEFFIEDGTYTLEFLYGGELLQTISDVEIDDGDVSHVTLQQFGAVADGVTDCADAFDEAIESLGRAGGTIHVPAGYYYISRRITVGANIIIQGEGAGTRTGRFVDAAYDATAPAWETYTGTVFVFAADTGGFLFPLHTDEENANTVQANMGATGSNATYWEFASSEGPGMRDCSVYSKGGTDQTKHGIEIRCRVHMENVHVFLFPGNCWHIEANTSSSTEPYGNSSCSVFLYCVGRNSGKHALYVSGRDANVMSFFGCDFSFAGAWCVYDNSLLGNCYVGCHMSYGNERFAEYPTAGASADVNVGSVNIPGTVNRSNFFMCYVESGNGSHMTLGQFVGVWGGNMATGTLTSRNGSLLVDGPVVREVGLRAQLRDSSGTVTVGATLGAAPTADPDDALQSPFGYGSRDHLSTLDQGVNSVELTYSTTTRHWFNYQPGVSASEFFGHFTPHSQVRKIAVNFRNGFYFGSPNDTLRNHVGAIAATTPEDGVYSVGDIRFYGAPTAGGKIGKVCTTAGVLSSVAWSAGVAANLWDVSENLQTRSHVTNGGNVYRLTAVGAGVTADAPVHGAGSVTGADGYTWLFMNSTAVPVFKEWGAIDA